MNHPANDAAARILQTTDDSFDKDVMQSAVPVLVDFWAPWCGPCKSIAPLLAEIAAERADIRVAQVNVDDNIASAQKYNVRAIPTLLMFQNGEVVGTQIGAASKNDLQTLINSASAGGDDSASAKTPE